MADVEKNKVLIVDDEEELCDILKSELEVWGYEVQVAFSGAQALQVLATFNPAVVLSDINMPGMNGIELLDKIQAINGLRPKVVMHSGFAGYDSVDLKKRGAVELLSKPFDYQRLEELLALLMNKVAK